MGCHFDIVEIKLYTNAVLCMYLLQFQNDIGSGFLELFHYAFLFRGRDGVGRQKLLECGNLVHAVAAVPVPVGRLKNGFPIGIHARSEASFPPISTRRIRKKVLGRKVVEISIVK